MTETKVQQIKLENLGISPPQLALSICLVVLGYMTYYVAPVSFLKQDMKTFTLMLNFVIIFMVIGLSFLSLLVLKWVELGVLKVLLNSCYWRSIKSEWIVQKNLWNHFSRNWKTALMFTLTLAFLIFSTANLDNIEYLITAVFWELVGADIAVLKFSSFVRVDPHKKYLNNA